MVIEPEPSNVEPWLWKLFFNGVANTIGNRVGAILLSLKGQQIPLLVKLNFDCTNNITEFGAYDLGIFGDYVLIISQIKGKVASQRHQVDYVSEVHQLPNPKVLEHYFCLFSPSKQPICRSFSNLG